MNAVSQETYGYDAATGNLAYKGIPSQTLVYADAAHKHAATSYNGWAYSYRCNGKSRI